MATATASVLTDCSDTCTLFRITCDGGPVAPLQDSTTYNISRGTDRIPPPTDRRTLGSRFLPYPLFGWYLQNHSGMNILRDGTHRRRDLPVRRLDVLARRRRQRTTYTTCANDTIRAGTPPRRGRAPPPHRHDDATAAPSLVTRRG